MKRFMLVLAVAFTWCLAAHAHFVYLVPQKDQKTIHAVFSDNLDSDEGVPIAKIASLKLFTLVNDKKETLTVKSAKHHLEAAWPTNAHAVFGTVDYGLFTRMDKTNRLVYHPKTVLTTNPQHWKAQGAEFEIVPQLQADGKIRFQFFVQGKPVADAEGSVLQPDDEKTKFKTDAQGFSPAYALPGNYGVWVKHTDPTPGQLEGKPFGSTTNYATLVVALKKNDEGTPKTITPQEQKDGLAALPKGVSSFGAVVHGGYLYVYGGHAGKTHTYSTADILGSFQRLELKAGAKWEELPGGPILQGMNLAAWQGKIYRVGGMQPRNAPGEKADMFSLADAAVFDVATKKWSALPPLPQGRSSHDLIALDGKLYVLGGWQQKGAKESSEWPDSAFQLDLANVSAGWQKLPQPFQRRALTAAVYQQKIYVLGGLDDNAQTHPRVDIYDPASKSWSRGPDFPGESVGFSPAANEVAGRLVLSTLDGKVHVLSTDGQKWETVGQTKGRMVHRLVEYAGEALLVGGATRQGNLTELETVKVSGQK